MSLKQHSRVLPLLLIAALMPGGSVALAQLRIVGSISGTVTDPSGAPVPGAKVVVKDEGTGISREVSSNQGGAFSFPDLAHGQYAVTVSSPGFQTAVVNSIRVSTSQTTDIPIRLTIGQQTESITVEGAAPVLEVTSQLVTTTTASKTINELPIAANRSNALSLARLIPGASPPGGGNTRYNNLPGGAVNVTVDGINNASNGFKSGGTVFYWTVPVRLGAVEEMSVETGGLGADSGAQSGANIKFVTRRGGSQYRGSVFYEPRSEQFNANTWSRNANGLGRVYSRKHDFGGNLGGRLVPFGHLKDKLFFFLNYEYSWTPLTSATTINVLTPDAQQGWYTYLVNGTTDQLRRVNVLTLAAANGASTRLDPVTQSIIATNNKVPQFATQLPSGNNFNNNIYQWNAENNQSEYFPATRFDYHITPQQQLTFSWNYRHSWQAGARRLPLEDVNRTNPFRLGYFVWSAALQSTLTPTTLNEFRYGVQHSGDSNRYAPNGLYYTYNNAPLRIGGNLPGENTPLGIGPRVPFIDQNNTTGRHFITTIYDTMTLIRGQHNITIGASYRKTDWKDTAEVFPVPTYALGTPSGDPLPSQLFSAANLPGIINTDTGNASGATALYNTLTGRVAQANYNRVVDPESQQYNGFINYTWTASQMGGAYIQDRWRISRDLTLNFGLRWEVQGNMHDVAGLTAAPDIKSIFGPSTGFFSPGSLSGNNDPTVEVGRDAFKPDYKNFAPNVGFAWNPRQDQGLLGKLLGGSKTVVRGSYGITYYDEGTQMFAGNLGPNAGKQISANIIPGQGALPAFTTLSDIVANPVPISAFPFASTTYAQSIRQSDQTFQRVISGMNPNLRAPYTINWSLGIQRELAQRTVLEVRYVGNQAHRAWRTSNLNEVNIFENGFLQEFKNAQTNLAANLAAGVNSFENLGRAGQVNLPIFNAAFGARGGVAAIAPGSGYGSASFITNLQNGQAGALANTLATNENYVCRMFGNSLSPCSRRNAAYNAPGVYPINFFLLNPYVAGRLNYTDDAGWNSYNGLQVQLRKQFSHGLTWTNNYTWSKSLTNLAQDNAQQTIDWTTLRNTSLDRRVSQFDIRHVIQTLGTYDLPIGKDRRLNIGNRILDGVIGGWTLGSVLVFNTGTPAQITGADFNTVNTSSNPASNGVFLAPGVTLDMVQDAFSNGARTRLTGRAGITDLQRLAIDPKFVGPDGRASSEYFLVNRTPGAFGDALFIRNKNTFNWDASIVKNFRLTERYRFQLFAAATNVLNHPSWGLGNTNIFSTTFGVVGAPAANTPNGGPGNRLINFRGVLSF